MDGAGMDSAQKPAVRVLTLAAETLGSNERLAARLGVAVADVTAWISGFATAPCEVFLAALDIVANGPFAIRKSDLPS
jgi:DNA-binding transcriptional regulator YiaG